jgi:hypothetical protein
MKSHETPDFIEQFIRRWLTSNLLYNFDEFHGNNVSSITKKDGTRTIAPFYDGAECLFLPETNYEKNWFEQHSFEQQNTDYLRENHPQIVDDYFDRLFEVISSSDFKDLFNFDGLESFITAGVKNEADATQRIKRLQTLSTDGAVMFKNRVTKLAGQAGVVRR